MGSSLSFSSSFVSLPMRPYHGNGLHVRLIGLSPVFQAAYDPLLGGDLASTISHGRGKGLHVRSIGPSASVSQSSGGLFVLYWQFLPIVSYVNIIGRIMVQSTRHSRSSGQRSRVPTPIEVGLFHSLRALPRKGRAGVGILSHEAFL